MYDDRDFNIYGSDIDIVLTDRGQEKQHIISPPPKRKRSKGNARVVLLFVMCLIVAAAAGFAGSVVAHLFFVDQTEGQATASFYGREVERAYDNYDTDVDLPASEIPYLPQADEHDNDSFASATIVNAFGRQQKTTAEVAAAVRDSVVEIKTETITAGMWGARRVTEGAGSGVIISEDGIIITNHHVISQAASITVSLADGQEFEARLIGADVRTDTAIIKIEATGLSPAVFGDSSSLAIGEDALAVGNPLGELGGTVTSGIISALDRDIVLDGEIMSLLQTDAAVNPGNSGGGLFNMYGELIGVVVAKSGGVNIEGLGFAIPSNTAKWVASDILSYGFVRGRADAGLEIVDINSTQLAHRYGVNQLGIYILSSEHEQLVRGDRVVAIDNRVVEGQLGFNAALMSRAVGETISVTVVRGGQEVTEEIMLREWRP
ncbi:MAG: trypsin-like peptidase domain-containing protein [Oscillospiraceae bacterium]|nr:trypsin-like peptidase domain-containing protein [Oscillospiraceae bacterium]